MTIQVKHLFKDNSEEIKNEACLYFLKYSDYRKTLKEIKYFEVLPYQLELDKEDIEEYHKLLMNSFIKRYIIPDRPLTVRFYAHDSWGLVFLVTSTIRLAWEFPPLVKNIIAWYKTGEYSADEALFLGHIIDNENPEKIYTGALASNHGYFDGSSPIKGIISRCKNLLELIEEEPGVEQEIKDFKERVDNNKNFNDSQTRNSLRSAIGYQMSNDLQKDSDLSFVLKTINIKTTIEQENE